MSFAMLVALNVVDEELYSAYRTIMTPLLQQHGGGLRFDFVDGRTLRSEADHPIPRVFAIHFPDEPGKDKFFSHPEYLAIRERYFTFAVHGRPTSVEYTR